MIIYTTIFGGYDELKPQPMFENVKYVCYSDTSLDDKGVWEVRVTQEFKQLSPRMKAKWFKCNSHKLFDEKSVFMDGSFALTKNAIGLIMRFNHYGVFKHPQRNCIYPEAQVSIRMQKYFRQPIQEQVDYYRGCGMPKEFGLWACGMLIRDTSKETERINEAWWEQNLKWSYQDQLSFPFVLWREKLRVETIEENEYNNPYFNILNHNRND